MKDEQSQHDDERTRAQERRRLEAARADVSRRRMLFSSGGIMMLAVGAAVAVEHAGWPSAMMRAERKLVRAAQASSSASPSASRSLAATGRPSSPTSASASASAPAPPPPPPPSPSPSPTVQPTHPQERVAAEPQYYVDDAGPSAIALTLDDGPHPVYTPQVLDILDRYGIQATFNMIGEQIGDNLSLVREVAAAGHTITNHTWDHADMRSYSLERVLSEIDRCNDALSDAGQQPTIFRAPYGYWTQQIFEACADRNLTPLGWSVDPQDWDTAHVTTQDIVNTVLRTTKRHDIILEHDGGGDRSNTVAALQIFIPELLDRGFVFAAV